MQILKVHIQNINSLRGSVQIDFDEPPLVHAGIFAITGPTGAGKSTILDSVTLALYGKVARNKQVKEVISYGSLDCAAEVEFEVEGGRYLASWRMHRARNKPDGKLVGPSRELAQWDKEAQVFRPVAEKIKEVEEAVERITRLDYQRFTRSVLLSQGDFAAFLRASDGERSELLERITGTAVYGELSKAAFQRHKQEQQELTKLQEQLQQIGIFEEEPVDKKQLTSAKKQADQLGQAVEKQLKEVQSIERWQEAKAKMVRLEQEQQQIQQLQQDFAPQQAKLNKHQALQPQAEALLAFAQREQDLAQTTGRLTALAQQQGSLKERTEREEKQLEQTRISFQEQQRVATKKEVELRTVEQLDQQILSEQQQLIKLQQRQEEIQEKTAAGQINLQAILTALQTQQTAFKNAEQWLSDHQHLNDLPGQIPRIEEQRDQLRKLYSQQNDKRIEQEDLKNQATTSKQAIQETNKALATCQQEQKKLETAFREQLPNDFTVNENAALNKLNQAITDLQNKRQIILQLSSLDQEYKRLLEEQQAFENRLGELLTRQQENNKELLTVVEQRSDFQEELQYKREVHRQQQLLANYTKDRQELQPGEPCPLCLSKDHPFHEHPVTPYVDKAKEELEKAEKYDQQLQQTERQLLQKESDLHKEVALLRGDDLDPLQGRLNTHRERLLNYEQQISSLLHRPEQEDDNWQTDRGQVLQDRLQALEKQLQAWQVAQSQLATTEQALATNSKKLQDLQQQLLQQQGEHKQIQARQEQLAKELQGIETAFSAAEQKINEHLSLIGKQFDVKTFKVVFDEIQQLAQALTKQQNNRQEAQQQLALLLEQQQSKTQLQEEVQAALQQLIEEANVQQQQLAKLNEKRHLLLGNQSVDTARQQLQEGLKQSQEALKQLESQQVARKEERSALLQAIKDRTEQKQQLQQQQKKVQTSLTKALQPLGYLDILAARTDLLPPLEASRLLEHAQQLTSKKSEVNRAQKETQEEEAKFRPADSSEAALQLVKEQWQSAKLQHQEQLQLLGQLDARYQQQLAREQQHQQLLEDIEKQRLEFNRWAALNEVIGQADGKKFRAFAQGLTLQRLVALANRHLELLNGRYLIAKTPGKDLSLDIIDTFQADNRRSMYTLSGGESFLISLALALGLSDLASRHAQIQSLFIDEGFGTLDEHSLDLALDTLENLQGSGKTIGIISHVKALKERIGVQIQVRKRSDGFSHIQVSS